MEKAAMGNSQGKPCIHIRRVFREEVVHGRVQIFKRAATLQLGLEAVGRLECLSDTKDILLVAKDC